MRLWRRRRTLVELLEADIVRSDDLGPEWPEVVEDAVLRQDMEWLADLSHDQVESAVRVVRPGRLVVVPGPDLPAVEGPGVVHL